MRLACTAFRFRFSKPLRLACTAFRFRFSKPLRLACTAFTFRFSKPLRLPCTAFTLALCMCVLSHVACDGPDIDSCATRTADVSGCVMNIRTYNYAYVHCTIARNSIFRVGSVSALRKCRVQRDIHVHVHMYADVGA